MLLGRSTPGDAGYLAPSDQLAVGHRDGGTTVRSTPITRGRSVRGLALASVLAAGGLLTIACGEKKEAVAPPPPEVLVSEVVRRDVPVVTELVGQTKGFQDVDIRA